MAFEACEGLQNACVVKANDGGNHDNLAPHCVERQGEHCAVARGGDEGHPQRQASKYAHGPPGYCGPAPHWRGKGQSDPRQGTFGMDAVLLSL